MVAHVGGGPTFYALPLAPPLPPFSSRPSLFLLSFFSIPPLPAIPLSPRARAPFSRELREEIVQADCILAWRTRTDSGKRLYRKHGGGDPSVPRVNIPRLSFMYRRWRYIVVKAGDAPGDSFDNPFYDLFPSPSSPPRRRPPDEGEEKPGG